MIVERTSIEVSGKGAVSAELAGPDRPDDSKRTGVIIAHGAANDMNNKLIVTLANGLASSGYVTLRFNFPYKEKGKKSPDTQPTLIQTWLNAYAYLVNNERFPVDRVVAAGKSMGGRIASQIIAAGQMAVDALIFLGYPLHAPGRTDKLRDSHLYDIEVPMLFFAGTRDTLCKMEKLKGVLDRLPGRHDLEVLEGGDHSFKLLKSSSRSTVEVHQKILERCIQWLELVAREK